MKSSFKLTVALLALALSFQMSARETILVTYSQDKGKAQLIEKILKRDVHLPAELIRLRYQKRPCQVQSRSIVQICISEKNEMRFVRFNQEVVQRSLSIFWEGKI